MVPYGDKDDLLATSSLLCFYSCSVQDFKPSTIAPSGDTIFIFLLGTRSLVMDKVRIARSGLMQPFIRIPRWLQPFLLRRSPLFSHRGLLVNLITRLPETSSFLEHKAVYIERIESLTVYLTTGMAAHTLDSQSVEDLSI